MAVIKSGDSAAQLKIDDVSQAARVTLYATDGTPLAVLLAGSVEITNDVGNAIPVSFVGGVAVTNLPATQPVSGSVSVSNLPATQPVSGTVAVNNLPATQTVAGAVSVSNLPSTQAVSGTVNVGTMPAVGVSSLPALPAGGNAIGSVTVSNTVPVADTRAALLHVTATGAAAAAVTASLPAVVGQFHYIVALEITAYSTAARTGGATPVVVTSSNLPGNPAWTLASAAAVGTVDRYQALLAVPLRSSTVNAATTVACPAVTGIIWRVNASYLTAP
jgi:hypothetical protein